MRVLLLGTLNSPNTLSQITAMAERGHDVTTAGTEVAALAGIDASAAGVKPSLRWDVIPGADRRLPANVRALRGLIERVTPDVIHANQMSTYALVAALAARGRAPVISSAWGSDILLPTRMGKWADKRSIKGSAVVAVNSHQLFDAVIEMGAERERVRLIRWGVDLDLFHPPTETRADLRKRLGLPDGRLIFSPRGVYPIYNHEVVIAAFERVADRIEDVHLLLKHRDGESPDLSGVGHADRIVPMGLVDAERMADLYRACDICVSVPSSDGSPNSVWEAMGCAAPCVLSDLPWLRGMVEPDAEAVVVPIDAEGLAAGLERLLDDPALAKRIGAGGRARVEGEHDRKVEMDRLSNLYGEVAGSGT